MIELPHDFAEGDGLGFEDVNAIVAAIRELRILVAQNKTSLKKVKTPASGIPANGSADCTVQAWNPFIKQWAIGQLKIACWNPSLSTPIGGSSLVTVAWVSGRWEVIVEPC